MAAFIFITLKDEIIYEEAFFSKFDLARFRFPSMSHTEFKEFL
jgi:hypothetical protein